MTIEESLAFRKRGKPGGREGRWWQRRVERVELLLSVPEWPGPASGKSLKIVMRREMVGGGEDDK